MLFDIGLMCLQQTLERNCNIMEYYTYITFNIVSNLLCLLSHVRVRATSQSSQQVRGSTGDCNVTNSPVSLNLLRKQQSIISYLSYNS